MFSSRRLMQAVLLIVVPAMLLFRALGNAPGRAMAPGPHEARFNEWLARFRNPPREYTVVPFWFWNDELVEREIIRQIDEFEDHGVYGFTLHTRIGLPDSIGF